MLPPGEGDDDLSALHHGREKPLRPERKRKLRPMRLLRRIGAEHFAHTAAHGAAPALFFSSPVLQLV